MKPLLLTIACAFGLPLIPSAQAAPIPTDTKNTSGPSISLQVKSIDQLLDTFKTTAKNFLPDPMYKEFEKEVLGKLDVNVIKSIDTTKPIGAYATIDSGLIKGDFSKSLLVLLVPITDEKDFLALLEKMEYKVEKKGDLYTFPISIPLALFLPEAQIEGSLFIRKGYAYIGIGGAKLDPTKLLEPKDVINAKETSAAVLRVRIDRIPDDLKKAAVQLMEKAFDQLKRGEGGPLDSAMPEILADYLKMAMRWTKMSLEDGKELDYRLDLDPKTGAIVAEMSLDGKPGSPLARSIADLKPTKNDFTGIIGSDSAAHALFQTPLFVGEIQNILIKLIDFGAKKAEGEIANGFPKDVHDLYAEAFKTLRRTVKNGDLDFAASLRGPDKNDQYTAIGAFHLKDTVALEKAVKAAAKHAGAQEAAMLKFDSFKIGNVNVHEILVADQLPPEAQKIFGKSNVLVALAPDAVFVTFGPQGKKLLEDALTMKHSPKPAPLLNAEVSGKRMVALLKNSGAPLDGPIGTMIEKLGKMDRISVFSVKVEGGDRLVYRYEIGALPILWFLKSVPSTNRNFQQVNPAPAIKKN